MKRRTSQTFIAAHKARKLAYSCPVRQTIQGCYVSSITGTVRQKKPVVMALSQKSQPETHHILPNKSFPLVSVFNVTHLGPVGACILTFAC